MSKLDFPSLLNQRGLTTKEVVDGIEGISLASRSGKSVSEITEAIVGGGSSNSLIVSSSMPEGFDWQLTGDIWSNFGAYMTGGRYDCSVKPKDLIDWSGYAKKIYVRSDGTSGASGASWASAMDSIGDAVDAAITAAVETIIYVESGIYTAGKSLSNTDVAKTLTAPIAIIGVYGDVINGAFDDLTWSVNATYSNVYEATRASVNNVIDMTLDLGSAELKEVDSILECSTTPSSFYTDNSIVYVNNGGVVTNSNIKALYSARSCDLSSNYDIFISGMTSMGGRSGGMRVAGGENNTIVFNRCESYFAIGGTSSSLIANNGFTVVDGGLTAFFDCVASYNSSDGFNFHSSAYSNQHGLVVRCKSYENGKRKSTSQSNNGLTSHESARIIDIGGVYLGSVGANHGHIDSVNVWAFGSIAGNSEGDKINGGSLEFGAFGIWGGTDAKLWLENCEDIGSTIGVKVTSGCTAYLRNHTGSGKYDITGTGLIEYF